MSETKEQEDSANTRPPAEQCEATPEYRSHVGRGKVALVSWKYPHPSIVDRLSKLVKEESRKAAAESRLYRTN